MSKREDSRIDLTSETYKVAKETFDRQIEDMKVDLEVARQESFALGAIKAFDINISQNEFLKIMALYRIKQAKDYRAVGMTWAEFCDMAGVPVRTADIMISEAKPLFESFSANAADLCGMPFNKIRQLGKSISAGSAEIKDNCLVYGDESIPLTPEYRDDVQALIERIGEEAKAIKEEAEAQVAAKDKVLKGKQELLNKQERQLRKYEKDAAAKGLTVEEDAFLQMIDNLKMSFDGYLMKAEPAAAFTNEDFGEPTPRMRAGLISMLHYMKMQVLSAYDTAITMHGDPAMNPELLAEFDKWQSENN